MATTISRVNEANPNPNSPSSKNEITEYISEMLTRGCILIDGSADAIGPYQIKRTIAMGGMGEVFLAALERTGGEKQVALKCVLPRFVQDARFKELFEREARLAAV